MEETIGVIKNQTELAVKRYTLGTVSVYQPSYKSKDGTTRHYKPRWRGRLSVGTIVPVMNQDGTPVRDANGMPKTKTKWKTLMRSFGSIPCEPLGGGKYRGKREAQANLAAWRDELIRRDQELAKEMADDDSVGSAASMLVPDFLDEYIRSLTDIGGINGQIESSTSDGYRYDALYAKEFFSEQLVGDITPKSLEEFKWHLNSTRSKQTNQLLSGTTKKKAFGLMRRAYRHAVKIGTLEKDPFERVTGFVASPPNPNPLDEKSYKRLKATLKEATATPLTTAICLAIRTGMRRGEICALRWRDVSTKTGEIVVSTAIGQVTSKSETYVKGPKGSKRHNNSRRIPGSKAIKKLLSARKAVMLKEAKMFGIDFDPDWYVVGDITGEYMRPSVLTKRWRAYSSALGLKGTREDKVTFHDLRHTFASRALSAGIDPIIVAQILGHRDPSITMTVYADALKESKDYAMKKLDAVL